MKAMRLRKPGGLDNLYLDTLAPREPGAGEIRVRIHASSLNFHDYIVARGMIPTPDGRIPMSDGAGIVEAVGAGVSEFKPGDAVVSTFFPLWWTGEATPELIAEVPGDRSEGYAAEMV
ncbi:MAG: alcohol dehydrogenase catalytic domain-containing protein, partial [Polymorphobacter sp.]